MAQVKGQSTENKIGRRLRGGGRGSIVFQQDYADCGTPSAIKSTFHRLYTDGVLIRLAHGIYYYPKEDKTFGLGVVYPSIEDIALAIEPDTSSNIDTHETSDEDPSVSEDLQEQGDSSPTEAPPLSMTDIVNQITGVNQGCVIPSIVTAPPVRQKPNGKRSKVENQG